MKVQHQKKFLANSFLLVCMFSVSIFGTGGITRICKDAFLISGNVQHSTLKRSLMPFYLYNKSFLLSCTSKSEADKKYCAWLSNFIPLGAHDTFSVQNNNKTITKFLEKGKINLLSSENRCFSYEKTSLLAWYPANTNENIY